MIHLGDITKINGAEIEPVWCITGGSPCQDLSVAGKRAGLQHSALGDYETTRSGLFMEQVRIVKEMRERDKRDGRTDELVRPRFLVWENVPGTFSSNFKDGFGDFGAVLEEIVRIAEPSFSLPRLPGKQKWTKAGAIDGDGWSIAWRTHDAQYWGVPQRRRRISIVADFGGQCAGEISFEREGLRGYFETGRTPRKGSSGNVEDCVGADDCEGEGNCMTPWDVQSRRIFSVDGPWPALYGGEGGGHGYACIHYTPKIRSGCWGGGKSRCDVIENKSPTLSTTHYGEPAVAYCGAKMWNSEDIAPTLTSNNADGSQRMPDKENFNCVCEPKCIDTTHANDVIRDCGSTSHTLQSRMGTGGNQVPIVVQRRIRWIVRRLTPKECERLQGYPDHWTDIGDWIDSKGKKHKGDADSPRYKALGNSIALPFWYWMFCRMEKYLPERATLGSLFDGIGGFPACWEAVHGKGTARWASEIEEFQIAVTKIRFPEK